MGLIVGSTDWLPPDIAIEKRKKLFTLYADTFGDENVYECPICITDNEVSIKRAMKDISRSGCNALCIYYANYGPESAGTLFAKEFDGPVMIIAAAEEGDGPYTRNRCDAESGFINACYALELRKTNVHIPDKPVGTIEECVGMLHSFISIARTLIALRNLKIISFEPRPSSYLASMVPLHPLYDMGVELSSYSELELLNSYQKHEADERIGMVAEEMKEELGEDADCCFGILPKLAQYEITINDWIRTHKGDRKYTVLTSTCWPAFPVNFGFVPCYVNSRITAKGVPVACEADVYGALTEYFGQCVSDSTVAILNINNNIPQEIYEKQIKGKTFNGKQYSEGDLFLGYHCGVTPANRLVSCGLKCHFVNEQLIGAEQSKGTLQGEIVPGPVTMFRIQGSFDGRLKAYIAQGQILPVSMETYGGRGIIAIPEMERFLRNVVIGHHFPNHTIIVFGHYGNELTCVLRQLGIKDIFYNNPKSIPYEGESLFSVVQDWY